MGARTIIVTGGFGSLGRAVSALFSTRGDRVARIDVGSVAPDSNDTGIDIAGIDLLDPHAAAQSVGQVRETLGDAHVLVNVAGGFAYESIAAGNLETWRRLHDLNLYTALNVTKAALPQLLKQRGASIINVGARAALQGTAGMGAYAASKSAIHRLTESLSEELSGQDVTVNAVLPSIIDTPANRNEMPAADISHWVTPCAIAEVIYFLASRAARCITGSLIPVTRGYRTG